MKLVIYPPKGVKKYFDLVVLDTGETLYQHWCSDEDYAMGDLYTNRPERQEALKERFGNVTVEFFDETQTSVEELMRRNQEWAKAQNAENKR
jgi:hypothetical protein